MNRFKQFILSISDLPLGTTNFEFEIENWFFEKFEKSEIKECKIKVDLSLEKQERMYFLHFIFDGFADMICDRCGDNFSQPLKGEENLIFKLGKDDFGENEDIIVLNEHDQHYDISQFIYENVTLLLPMQRIHPKNSKGKNACNKETLKILEKLTHKQEETDATDPRWDALKKLK